MEMKTKLRLDRFEVAGVKCIALEPANEGNYPLVIMMHGLGDQGDSYIDVGTFLNLPYRFVFPTAPPPYFPAPFASVPVGFSWFHLDLTFSQVSKDVASARPLFNNLVSGLRAKYQTPANRTIVGGFSQGGMLTLDSGLRYRSETGERLAGLIAMSTLLPNDNSAALPELKSVLVEASRSELPVFIAHGSNDPMIPPRLGRATRDLLKETGVKTEYFEFLGFHEINLEVLQKVKAFLERVL